MSKKFDKLIKVNAKDIIEAQKKFVKLQKMIDGDEDKDSKKS